MPRIRVNAMGDYTIQVKIGEGSFSTVYKVQKNGTKETYAMKVLKDRYQSLDEIQRNDEIQVMLRLGSHQNVVTLHDIIFEPKRFRLSLVMDLMECNLLNMITPDKSPIGTNDSLRLVYQMLAALAHLHSLGYIHRDIKPENCLVNPSNMSLKLADFGSTRRSAANVAMTEYIATRWYRPPECLLTSGDYGSALDIWAVGCVLYEIMTKKPLFPGTNSIDQLRKIHSITGAPDPEALTRVHAKDSAIQHIQPTQAQSTASGMRALLPNASDDLIDLFERLLAYVPDDRITAADALNHKVFAEINFDNNNNNIDGNVMSKKLLNVVESAPTRSPVNGERMSRIQRKQRLQTGNHGQSTRGRDDTEMRSQQQALPMKMNKNPRIILPNSHLLLIGKAPATVIGNQPKHSSRMNIFPSASAAQTIKKPKPMAGQGSRLPGIRITSLA